MTKAERRLAMPESTKFLDDMRVHFGEPVYIYARENGHEVTWRKRDEPINNGGEHGRTDDHDNERATESTRAGH